MSQINDGHTHSWTARSKLRRKAGKIKRWVPIRQSYALYNSIIAPKPCTEQKETDIVETFRCAVGHQAHQIRVRKRRTSVDGSNQGQSPFFSILPPELRNQIYEMVLCGTQKIQVGIWEDARFDNGQLTGDPEIATGQELREGQEENKRSTSLLLACRRTYREAIGLLYAQNVLSFQYLHDFVAFSQIVPPKHLGLLRSVVIHMDDRCGRWRHCKSASSLQGFHQCCHYDYFDLGSAFLDMSALKEVVLQVFIEDANSENQIEILTREVLTHVETTDTTFYIVLTPCGSSPEQWWHLGRFRAWPFGEKIRIR